MTETFQESEFDSQDFPLNCEKCERLGYVFVDNLDQSFLAVCTSCGGESANVWCPACRMGGYFVRDSEKRPRTWNCPNCGTRYFLPESFYDAPLQLFSFGELPPKIQERIDHARIATQPKFTFVAILAILVLFLWPIGLGVGFALSTGNPLWYFAGLVGFFGWLHLGKPIIASATARFITVSRKLKGN